jgi:hypothetical protein
MSKKDLIKVLSSMADTQHKIPSGVAAAARKGLEMRKEFNRGGTDVGLNRAKQLSTQSHVSGADLKQIYSYFQRHAVDKNGKDWDKPSNGKIAFYLWGGPPGETWSEKERMKMDKPPVKKKKVEAKLHWIDELKKNAS